MITTAFEFEKVTNENNFSNKIQAFVYLVKS